MVLLLVFFMLVSCTQLGTTGSGKPTWLDRGYDATYDEATYLCAVGSGSNRERAVDSALSSLSQVFNAQVRSLTEVTSLSSRETDAAGNVTFAESSEMVESGSVASQTGNIIGAEVVGTYIDDLGRVYVRVALHRKRTAELYKNRIAELAASLSQARTKSALGFRFPSLLSLAAAGKEPCQGTTITLRPAAGTASAAAETGPLGL